MLTTEKKQLIQESLRSLARLHAAAVTQIEQTISFLSTTLELEAADLDTGEGNLITRPVVHLSTFCVSWAGHECFLGNTLMFWMFERLARSLNQYVPHVDLLDDVWHGERENSTIRGIAKRLRDELISANMADLAAAIKGDVPGHYGLILV